MLSLRAVPLVVCVASLLGAGPAQASEPQDPAYQEARQTAHRANTKADAPAPGAFDRAGCLSDPSKCKCQYKDQATTSTCASILGHFCPDSTLRYLASSCMDLFGGATLCQCAATKQIENFIKAEDAAAAKAEKKAKAKAKPKAKAK